MSIVNVYKPTVHCNTKLAIYYNRDMTNIAIMYHALITPRGVIKERGFAPP